MPFLPFILKINVLQCFEGKHMLLLGIDVDGTLPPLKCYKYDLKACKQFLVDTENKRMNLKIRIKWDL